MGIEASCDQNDESNEAALLALFDGNDGFGSFLSNPFESDGSDGRDSEPKQNGTGDGFLPSQLLSDLLSSTTDPAVTKVSRWFSFEVTATRNGSRDLVSGGS